MKKLLFYFLLLFSLISYTQNNNYHTYNYCYKITSASYLELNNNTDILYTETNDTLFKKPIFVYIIMTNNGYQILIDNRNDMSKTVYSIDEFDLFDKFYKTDVYNSYKKNIQFVSYDSEFGIFFEPIFVQKNIIKFRKLIILETYEYNIKKRLNNKNKIKSIIKDFFPNQPFLIDKEYNYNRVFFL